MVRAGAALSAMAIPLLIATATPVSAAGGAVSISSTGCSTFYCYKPAALSVTNGSAVAWTDSSHVSHTVTRCTAAACSGTGPGSGTDSTFTSKSVAPNGSASQTFHGTGTYNYYCTLHGYGIMHGTVTVTEPK